LYQEIQLRRNLIFKTKETRAEMNQRKNPDRDYNSAINIFTKAQVLGSVEKEPLSSNMRVSSICEAGSYIL